MARKIELMPACFETPLARIKSPSRLSSLITSAPKSPSIWVASGPSTTEVKSSTRTPASGPALFPGLMEGEAGAGADMGQVK